MRFLSLNLQAFGPFTDTVLDLSGGAEGLHLVFGPNEAGKSAALRALRDLLYGIPARTTDSFLHDNRDLRIAAALRRADGAELEIVRRKGNKNTLLDPAGQPMDEQLLQACLGSVPREVFTTMFGLGHDELVRGGADLAAGQGDLGQSLFAAGAGTAGMRDVLAELDAEADGLFKRHGKVQKINELLGAYAKQQDEIKARSLRGEDWKAHRDALSAAQEEKADLESEQKEVSRELSRLERIRRVKPKLAAHRGLDEELKALGDVPAMEEGFPAERAGLQGRLAEAKITESRLASDAEALAGKIAKLAVPEDLTASQDEVARLHGDSRVLAKALTDLPKIEGERATALAQAEALLEELGTGVSLYQAPSLRLTLAERTRVTELRDAMQDLLGRQKEARDATAALAEDVEDHTTGLAELPAARDAGPLKAAVREARTAGNLEDRLAKARRKQHGLTGQVQAEMKELGLWSGGPEELAALRVPMPETVRRFETGLDKHAGQIGKLKEQLADRETEARQSEKQLRALELAGAVPTEADLALARRRRDALWELVRALLAGDEPDATALGELAPEALEPIAPYEQAVREADEIADRMRRESERVARRAELDSAIGECGEAAGRLKDEIAVESEALATLEREWREEWSDAAIEPLPPREMAAWLVQRQALVQKIPRVRQGQEEIEALENDLAANRERLARALADLGEEAPGEEESLAALLDRCEEAVGVIEAVEADRASLRKQLASAERRRKRTRATEEKITQDLAACRTDWGQALGKLGLAGETGPSEASLVLERIDKLLDHLKEAEKLTTRIEAIGSDAEAFGLAVRDLCGQLAPELAEKDPMDAIAALHAKATQAAKDRVAREQLLQSRQDTEKKLEEARATIQAAGARLAEMCSQVGAEKPERLPAIEQRCADAANKRRRLDEMGTNLLAEAGDATLAELAEEADSVDADDVPALLAGAKERLAEIRTRQSELDQTIGQERGELARMDGSDAAADLADQAQGVLAGVAEAARRWALLRIAAAVLRRQIERYRKAHQGPVLARAADVFARITCGSFASVESDFDEKDNPVLVGVRADRQRVRVAGLSDGTRDQLYLALRLASLEHHLAAAAEAMPLVLDDLLVNFDNARSRATLEVLAEVSTQTQVIFFTHHRHLVALAREAVGESVLRVHTLGE